METGKWQLERRVSVSVILQLVTLAGLILGSWVNLQRQLDLIWLKKKTVREGLSEAVKKMNLLLEEGPEKN